MSSNTGPPEGSNVTAMKTPRGRTFLLRLCDRFGMDGNKSEAERADELNYRAERLEEIHAEFSQMVAEKSGLEAAIRRIHSILNRQKRYRNFHRLMKLLHPKGYMAGNYRLTRQRGADYLAPRAADVPVLMHAFGQRLDDLVSKPLDDAEARSVCGWALAMMIRIHPFADGNGRTTRTLINLLLARAGHATIDFPSDSDIYKRSPVWSTLKGHMRIVRDELGWSLRSGSIPPSGYYEQVLTMLERENATVSVGELEKRPDITAIAEALDVVRREGFDDYREA
jgi:fido (protein-threonine AMPylation protein)